jgi:hypothetical protein
MREEIIDIFIKNLPDNIEKVFGDFYGSAKTLFCEPYLNTQRNRNTIILDTIVVVHGERKSLIWEQNSNEKSNLLALPIGNLNQ